VPATGTAAGLPEEKQNSYERNQYHFQQDSAPGFFGSYTGDARNRGNGRYLTGSPEPDFQAGAPGNEGVLQGTQL
jgi:hypothetical protein